MYFGKWPESISSKLHKSEKGCFLNSIIHCFVFYGFTVTYLVVSISKPPNKDNPCPYALLVHIDIIQGALPGNPSIRQNGKPPCKSCSHFGRLKRVGQPF